MAETFEVLRVTDDQARHLGRRLVRESRHAAIALLDPESGGPLASRVLTGTDVDGAPVVLVSALAPHAAALRADPRASILFGHAGKGDPLAHARITVKALSEEITREDPAHGRIRARFVARHPKSSLYIDFPDFAFFRLVPVSGSLNGGFGRAYAITAEDLIIASPAIATLAEAEAAAIEHMNADHAEAVDLYAQVFSKSKLTGWRLAGIDAAGIDLANGDQLLRIEFDAPLKSADELRPVLVNMAGKARQKIG